MSSDVSVRVEGLSKAYRIYSNPSDRLRQAVLPRLGRAVMPLLPRLGKALTQRPYFNEFWALRALSFEVRRGETVGILGRNGSGKSTLLQLICGTLSPTQGQVQVNGRVAALLELGSGFNPEYTGRENVFLNASVLGLSREETIARLDDIIAFADIGDFLDQPVKTYSSGMAMRLAFSVIAHVDADILVIDEALAVGDVMFQQKCFRWLRSFQERGTLIYCGHDTGAILGLCNRALWINRGDLIRIGTAREVVDAYAIFNSSGALPGEAVAAPSDAEAPARDAPPEERQAVPAERPAPAAAPTRQALVTMQGERTSHGSGDAQITDVRVSWDSPSGAPWLAGGEDLHLVLRIEARADIDEGVVGFILKDRLGQSLMGDNTVDLSAVERFKMRKGEVAEGHFRFRLPLLATGHYSISPAFASGTQLTHVNHHWIHDAVILDVRAPRDIGSMMLLSSTERSLRLLSGNDILMS